MNVNIELMRILEIRLSIKFSELTKSRSNSLARF